MSREKAAKLLVTGATGQIGAATVRRMLSAGWHVRIIARSREAAASMFSSPNLEIVQGDICDSAIYRNLFDEVTHVCHCAAKVGDWGTPAEYWQTNVEALGHLLDAAVATNGLQKFIHISSLGVYAPHDHFGTDENTPICKNGLDPYNQTKARAEEIVSSHALGKKCDMVILRPGFVYGPGDRHVLPGLIRTLRKKAFAFIGTGEDKLDQISVKNVAYAVDLALTSRSLQDKIFNITDGELVTRRTFVNTVADLMELPRPERTIPKSVGKQLAYTCDSVGRLLRLGKPPLLTKARYKFLALNLEYSTQRARSQLGFNPPQSFRDGMAEAVAWYRAQHEGA